MSSASGSLASSWSAASSPVNGRVWTLAIAPRTLRQAGVDRVRVDAVARQRVRYLLRLALARLGQCLEHGDDDLRGVGLEVAPQRGAGVAATEAVGAEDGEGTGHPTGDLVGHGLHEV